MVAVLIYKRRTRIQNYFIDMMFFVFSVLKAFSDTCNFAEFCSPNIVVVLNLFLWWKINFAGQLYPTK